MSDPYKNEVECYWCQAEGWDAKNAVAKATGPFEGDYACSDHANLLLVAGYFGGMLEERPKTLSQYYQEADDAG